ncbi:MAG: putative Na+/H+ antiporter [Gammaproteobacteria bacterium]|nr:putative Na+/H+ antiporter [Gammaproteobacteria bacterium]
MNPSTIELIATGLFALAILHTFSTKFFEHLAHARPAHAGLWHLLGEVEIVFGFWSLVLVAAMIALEGLHPAIEYVDTRNFVEPMFVFAIMVIAGTRPIFRTALGGVRAMSKLLPLPGSMGFYFAVLTLGPLLGSLFTEPAAMTLSALILSERVFARGVSERLKYATLGVLFVNVSIGGTLTPFAAPPVLMVAAKWHWDLAYMIVMIGWKAIVAVAVNAGLVTLLFFRELSTLPLGEDSRADQTVPLPLILVHIAFLLGIVAGAHHPPIFMALFLFFLGVANAYPQFQEERLILREGLLVAFFLAGLVVLGGMQEWWLRPLLLGMSPDSVFVGATLLTAITDNAALTYLGSLVEGLSDEFKYALVTGAVTGGGLTVIANAPNPAGFAILRGHFTDAAVNPLGLLVAALPPTLVAALAFKFL